MTIRSTGGGRFDPDEEPIYFFAGLNNSLLRARGAQHSRLLIALNDIAGDNTELESIDTTLTEMPDVKVLLDSGIFWLTNKHARARPGMTMDEALGLKPTEIDGFEWLYSHYVDTVRRFEDRLWGYIELDQGGAKNKRLTRAKLHKEGLNPIPVYHPLNDGWEYFDELARSHDRICVGNIVQARSDVRKHLLATVWERRRKYPHLWIHVLGLTPNEIFTVYPQASCDSSTFVFAVRFGATAAKTQAMNQAFGGFTADFSYRPEVGLDDPGGYSDGIQFVTSGARFLHENQRAHFRDFQRVFETELWPKPVPREGVKR